jgi:hypothetical protein
MPSVASPICFEGNANLGATTMVGVVYTISAWSVDRKSAYVPVAMSSKNAL